MKKWAISPKKLTKIFILYEVMLMRPTEMFWLSLKLFLKYKINITR